MVPLLFLLVALVVESVCTIQYYYSPLYIQEIMASDMFAFRCAFKENHGIGDAGGPKHSLIIVKNGNRSKHDVPDVIVIVVRG